MGIVEGMHGLRDIIPELDKRFRYAVEVEQNFLYIRFIGDRTIQENDFGEIQKDIVSEMKNGPDLQKE